MSSGIEPIPKVLDLGPSLGHGTSLLIKPISAAALGKPALLKDAGRIVETVPLAIDLLPAMKRCAGCIEEIGLAIDGLPSGQHDCCYLIEAVERTGDGLDARIGDAGILEMETLLLALVFDRLPAGLDKAILGEEVSLAIYLVQAIFGRRSVLPEILFLSIFCILPAAARQDGDAISGFLVLCSSVLAACIPLCCIIRRFIWAWCTLLSFALVCAGCFLAYLGGIFSSGSFG